MDINLIIVLTILSILSFVIVSICVRKKHLENRLLYLNELCYDRIVSTNSLEELYIIESRIENIRTIIFEDQIKMFFNLYHLFENFYCIFAITKNILKVKIDTILYFENKNV